MKKIMLLGGSPQQVIAITTAKRLGLYTILCDYLPDNPGQHYADKFYLLSTTDKDAILNTAKSEQIDFIIAYASDPAAPTASYVAEKLGLPGNPYKSVDTLCNKSLFREFLEAHDFNTPSAENFTAIDEALEGLRSFTLPVIVKPVDSSGSKGITVLHTHDGAEQAVKSAFSFSRSRHIIIEQFIEKKHPYLIGGDILVSEGRVIQYGLMNCHRDSRINPLVPAGKSYPPALDDTDLQNIKDSLQRLVSELGIRFGAMNVEAIVNSEGKVFLIDIGPRSGGNMIPDLLGMVFDCDLVEMSIRASMGEKVSLPAHEGHKFYATHNLHSDIDGTFEGVEFSREITPFIIRTVIYKKPGDEVKAFTNAAYAVGIVFFRFSTQEEMNMYLSHIYEHVKVSVKLHKGGGVLILLRSVPLRLRRWPHEEEDHAARRFSTADYGH